MKELVGLLNLLKIAEFRNGPAICSGKKMLMPVVYRVLVVQPAVGG
jgi:hypothetical protein